LAGLAAGLLLAPSLWASDAPTHFAAPPPDAEVSRSGLAWKVLQPGDGERNPDPNDLVLVNYTGWTKDGVIFQTNVGSDQIRLFDLETVFPGWREGITRMVSGEKRRLWIPENLGPRNADRGPEGPVVFDVELVGFRLVPNPPASRAQAPPDAERLPSGSWTKVLEAGTGEEKPGPSDRVLVNYYLWNQRGRTFDSTLRRGRPTAFLLDMVMPQFSEAVQQMVVGEKRYIWVPASVLAQQWPDAPKQGMASFLVELLRILPDNALQLKDPPEGAEPTGEASADEEPSGEASAGEASSGTEGGEAGGEG
jgi:peptidylprolyl isomerase